MKFYAEYGARRSRQFIADALMLGWLALSIALGMAVAGSFDGAQDGANKIGSSGSSLSSHLSDAGNFVSALPFAGGELKGSFDHAADAATSMSTAGHDLSDGLGFLALLLGCLTAAVPILLALMPWALLRIRYARRAGRLARLRAMPGAEKLLALETLTHASPRTLHAISDDPAGLWQRGDEQVTRRLAEVTLASYGLRGAAATSSSL